MLLQVTRHRTCSAHRGSDEEVATLVRVLNKAATKKVGTSQFQELDSFLTDHIVLDDLSEWK